MKQIKILLIIFLFSFTEIFADEKLKFSEWKKDFKKVALENNISENTFNKRKLFIIIKKTQNKL